MVSRQCGFVSDGAILLGKKMPGLYWRYAKSPTTHGRGFVRAVMREVFHARYSCNFSIYWLIKIVVKLLCEGGGPMHKWGGQGNSLGRQFIQCVCVCVRTLCCKHSLQTTCLCLISLPHASCRQWYETKMFCPGRHFYTIVNKLMQ